MRLFALFFVATASLLPAEQAAFSHSVHRKLNLDCKSCHAAALTSTKAEDNLLPPKQICQACHKNADVPGPQPTLVAKFSHEQHLKMGNLAPLIAAAIDHGNYLQPVDGIRGQLDTKNPCEACHRGIADSTRISHANMPQMADCLVCHAQIDPPFSCETCHLHPEQLKPASHVPHFIDLHSSGKVKFDKTTCAVCHGRTFTCMGCH